MQKNDEEKYKEYYILGLAYEAKQDYFKAKEFYIQAIEINPSDEDAKARLTKLN